MTQIHRIALVIVLIVGSGCASSRNTSTVVSEKPQPVEASEPEAEAGLESGQPPENWLHLDGGQSHYHGISSEKSYASLLMNKTPGQRVVVAVLDSGIDVEHEDLQDVIWTNDDEVSGNEIDDDNNGYVDDVHGWNFIGGADGENVGNDTFEVTREYVRMKARYEGADTTALSPEEKEEYAYYQEIMEAYEAKVAEMTEMSANINTALELLVAANSIMSEVLGSPDFTMDQVRAVESEEERVQQAKGILVYFDQVRIDAEEIENEKEVVEGYLELNLNTDFDPRPIVGDNYEDVTESIYGNRDVEGPDAFHGTHVAGIIAASRGNGLGVDGIAGNVEIMPVRVVPDGDERDKDVANGIRYAVDNGAQIINMSFGKDFSPYKPVVDEAVRYAISNNVLLIHAAGNDGANNDSTSNYPQPPVSNGRIENSNWIEVGASSWQDLPNLAAPFSNYGQHSVDVFAPGVSIYSTAPGSEYKRADGTSMASPVVAGLAALIMTYYPELTAAQVKDVIVESAISYTGEMVVQPGTQDRMVPFGTLSKSGSIVNAYEALKLAEERAGM